MQLWTSDLETAQAMIKSESCFTHNDAVTLCHRVTDPVSRCS